MSRRFVVFAVGLVLVAATGSAADIALFNNTTYVDWSPGSSGSEASNVFDTLVAQGNTVSTFTGITAADWTAAVAGKSVLVIPELESGDLAAAIDGSARAAIAAFVDGGGTLFMFGSNAQRAYDLLNATFTWTLSTDNETAPYPITTEAVGTAFEGGPATLPYNNDTSAMNPLTLPPGTKVIYVDADTPPNPSVVVPMIPEGSGLVIFFGWDWYNAQPTGTLDGGWLDVMDRAVSAAGGFQGSGAPIPTLSQWGVITLVLIIGTLGVFMVARRRLF